MRKIVLSIFTILMLCFSLSAQNQRVTGTVVDNAGQPLVGATVLLKDTQTAAVTGLDGQYSINVPANGVLVFSSLGYTTKEIAIANKTTVNAILELNVEDAGSVLVIGYGSGQDIATAAGTISTVNSEIVKDRPSANIADALQGQVSGLSIITSTGEPGAESSIVLHGIGSLSAGNTPLFVVDGLPTSSNVLQRLSSHEIESINVLKDASATSIYGSRASNGVIYITTKKGKRDQQPVVTLSAYYGISSPSRKSVNVMGVDELLDWQLEFGEINVKQYTSFKKTVAANGGGFDWFDYLFPEKSLYNVDFSVEGGSQTTNYFVSGNYMWEDGIAPASYYERYNFSAKLDTEVRKWLRFGTNLSVSYRLTSRAPSAQGSSGANASSPGMLPMVAPPYLYPYDEKGNVITNLDGQYIANPYQIAILNPGESDNLYLTGQAYMNINPVKGFNIRSMFGADVADNTSKRFVTNEWGPAFGTQQDALVSRGFGRNQTFINTNTIEYKFDVNSEHNFTVLAGHEGMSYKTRSFTARKWGQVDDRMLTINNGTIINLDDVGDGFNSYASLSFFGRANYNYLEKYSVDLTMRNDASSRFGPSNRNSVFYSAGLLWNLKKENFLAKNNTISSLTFRTSYGTQGNSEIGFYDHLALIGIGLYGGKSGWGLGGPGNRLLTWENQAHFSAGFELGLWNKLTLTLSYYHRKSSDMLLGVPVSYTTGFGFRTENIGSMVNQGLDLDLSWTIHQDKNWFVNFSTVFTYNSNRITELFNGVQEWPMPSYNLIYKVGTAYGRFYIEEFMGVDPRDGLPMFNDGNGNPTKDINKAAQILSDKQRYAPVYGGFNIDVSWKGISLNANFSYMLGNHIVVNDDYFLEYTGMTNMNRSTRMRTIWRNPGDITDIPKYGSAIPVTSTFNIQNASFLRLKNISLSYSLPKSILEKSGFIAGAKVYFRGRNLLTLTNYTGYDPELASNITLGAYPMTKQYAFGVELTF